jgi:2-polyprenyl-3-methyl-5-hydroxy-6-metoxy-1,4-benzoquinol methylase
MIPLATFRRLLCLPGVQYVTTRFCGPVLRRLSFDEKFRTGQWNFSGEAATELAEVVEQYVRGGDILMLGCGTAAITRALRPDGFNTFLGIDVSTEAIDRARLHGNERIRFELGDMLSFKSESRFNVILFSESLYYLKVWQRKRMLDHALRMLRPDGRIIITISQPTRFGHLLRMIRQNFSIIEDRSFRDSQRRLFVVGSFSPR